MLMALNEKSRRHFVGLLALQRDRGPYAPLPQCLMNTSLTYREMPEATRFTTVEYL
jgi:hypothetical protein